MCADNWIKCQDNIIYPKGMFNIKHYLKLTKRKDEEIFARSATLDALHLIEISSIIWMDAAADVAKQSGNFSYEFIIFVRYLDSWKPHKNDLYVLIAVRSCVWHSVSVLYHITNDFVTIA